MFLKCKHLAALQPVLVLSLQPVQGGTEPLLLLGGNHRVRLLQEGASRLGYLQELSLLSLELLELRLERK